LKIFVKKRYSDQEILESIRNNSEDRVLRFLYKEVLPSVRKYIVSNKGSIEEAHDIFQDAVIRFYHAVKQNRFRGDCSISSFIFGISKNLYLNSLRIKNRYDKQEEITDRHDDKNLLEDVISEERVNAVKDLMNQMGDGCKQLLTYTVYENLSMKEIVHKMGYSSEDVAKTYHYRCKKKLMDLIASKPYLLELLGNEHKASHIRRN
jgi:RNA polymerase sigma factor (sigma-70 family)